MSFTIGYFHARVKAEIESWPDDLLADFARMVELLMDADSRKNFSISLEKCLLTYDFSPPPTTVGSLEFQISTITFGTMQNKSGITSPLNSRYQRSFFGHNPSFIWQLTKGLSHCPIYEDRHTLKDCSESTKIKRLEGRNGSNGFHWPRCS